MIYIKSSLWIAVVASLLSATAFGDDLPAGIVNTQAPADVSLSPQASLERMTLPAGFHVTLFAGEPDVRRPIAFDFDDRGRLWVVENYSHPKASEKQNPDRIVILEDSDNDGQFDKRKVFWSGGRYLSAIAYGHGGVWIGNSPELSFIPDRNRDDVPDSEPIVILDGFVESANNVLNNFHWGPDGWLYGAIGLKQVSYVGKPGTPKIDRVGIPRGIWRMHPVTHQFEVQAMGMVNPWGADFNEYGDLITTNTVIAHLWHIVPGMNLQRRGNEESFNRYAYGLIQSINDHLHWGSGRWTNSRQSNEGELSHQHSVAGGGHAHCGGMVYLGDNWPDKYRGKFFTCNLHGNRVNMDNLVPNKSTYVGTHGDDFLMANDPWFRGLSIKYGPDGGVYISDWHDFGECHDTDGSHRTSGRIYKIVYGDAPQREAFDLTTRSTAELVALQTHKNAWYRRHARRILHERTVLGDSKSIAEFNAVGQRCLPRCRNSDLPIETVLPTLWTLNVTGQTNEDDLLLLAQDTNEHVRRWAVRIMSELPEPGIEVYDALEKLSRDPSAKVRLAVAVALQRIPLTARWDVATGLLSNGADAADPYLPLMIWYGVEPLVSTDITRAMQLAQGSQIPQVRQFVVRRMLDVAAPRIDSVILATLGTSDESHRIDILRGMHEALSERGQTKPPARWGVLYDRVSKSPNPELRSVAADLARTFGDERAIAELRNIVANNKANIGDRKSALRALLDLEGAVTANMLHGLLGDASLRTEALQALRLINDDSTPGELFAVFSELSPVQRQAATSVFVSRARFAEQLIEAIGNAKVSRRDVSAYALQDLRSYKSAAIRSAVDQIWPPNSADASKADEIAKYKRLLTPEYLKSGDAEVGRKVFSENCAKCHTLFGVGGSVGPDLTGSGRKNLDYVLSNLVDPNALVDEAYRLTTIEMNDGRLVSGFIQQHGENRIVLRTQDSDVSLPFREIEDMQTSNRSMMPEGLLRTFGDEQLRDLVVYLASPDQVDLPLVE